MLTTLSIVSLDQGKIWREPGAPEPVAETQPEREARRPALLAAWLRTALRLAARTRPA